MHLLSWRSSFGQVWTERSHSHQNSLSMTACEKWYWAASKQTHSDIQLQYEHSLTLIWKTAGSEPKILRITATGCGRVIFSGYINVWLQHIFYGESGSRQCWEPGALTIMWVWYKHQRRISVKTLCDTGSVFPMLSWLMWFLCALGNGLFIFSAIFWQMRDFWIRIRNTLLIPEGKSGQLLKFERKI